MMIPTPEIDHTATAAALDRAYAAMAALDSLLASSGAISWQPPRAHALAAFGELHRLRDQLHTLAAGPGVASAYRTCATAVAAPLAPQAPGGGFTGPSPEHRDTGNDDCGPSLHNGLAMGPSTATAQPQQPRSTEAIAEVSPEANALTGPHFASETASVYPDTDV